MKFSRYAWDLYWQSEQGRAVIESFLPEVGHDCYDLAARYNPHTPLTVAEAYADLCDCVFTWTFEAGIKSIEEAKCVFESMIDTGVSIEGYMAVLPGDYRNTLALISPISFGLYAASEFFFPNLFQYNFFAFRRIADFFEIDIPAYPKKSDHRARCMFYWELCEVLYLFRAENDLSKEELCAFLYDFAPNMIGVQEHECLPESANAWFIGGVLGDG